MMTRRKAEGSTRSKLLRSTPLAGGILAGLCLMAAPARAQPATNALPSGPAVGAQSGSDTITFTTSPPAGSPTLTVDLGDNEQSIINWTSFDIGEDSTVDFDVAFATPGAVLNRVTGATFSQIYGDLTGPNNLTIFLINANGIVYGPTAAVNVGGLVSSTLDLADADFMNGSAYNFTGTATTGVTILAGASLNANTGPLVVLGGFVGSAGTLTSGGDIVFAAASDVSMTLAAGSPLSMTINQGTPVGGTVVDIGGTVTGRNVYAAVASRTGVLDALLNVSGTITANTVAATDRGIVLAAGTSATGVTIATGGGNDTAGPARIAIAGTLDANDDEGGDVANIEIRSTGDVTGAGAIDSEDLVDISSFGGDVILTGADAIDAGDGITVTAADVAQVTNADTADGNLTLTGNTVNLAGSTLAADDGNIAITGAVTASGTSNVTAAGAGSTVTFSNTIDGAGTLNVSSTAGTTFAGSVGGTTALTALSITGAATLNGSAMLATDGITTDNLALGFAGTVTVDADADNNATGNLAVGGDDITKTGGGTTSVVLGGAAITVDDVTGFDDVTFENATSLGGDVSAADDIAFLGAVTLTGAGAQAISGDQVNFAGTLNGASDLTITSPGGTVFGGDVGAATALSSLDVIGATTLNASTIQANGDIDLDAVTVGAVAAASIIADDNGNGTGDLTIAGNLSSSAPGTTNLTLSGNAISVGNVGIGGSFADIDFLDNTTLSGDIQATGEVFFDDDLILTGAGVRTISAGSAVFGVNSQDDISSAVDGQTGLAVSVTGTADFNGDIGTAAGSLSAFGISANTVSFDILDSNVRADVLAINVTSGNISLTSDENLVIGVVGPVSGLSTGDGDISVVLVSGGPSNPSLTVNGQVSAFGDVLLSAEGDISGSAVISSGVGNVVSGADVLLIAGDDISVGNVSSNDDIVIDAGGTLVAGSLTTGNIDGPITDFGDAHVGQLLAGGDVVVVADGIQVGAINVTSDITLDGGATGIGVATQDLSLFAPGNITLVGEAIGIDVALNAGGAITTGDLTARDDVAISGGGLVSTGDVTSGATINALGPVDVVGAAEALFGFLDWTGHDAAILGNGLNFGAVRANGSQSDILIDTLSGAIGAGSRDLDLAAGGNITLFDAAQGRDISLDAGGSISTGTLTARDDVAIRAGAAANTGIIATGQTVDALGAVNVDGAADALLPGADATGADLSLEAASFGISPFSHTVGDDLSITDTSGGLTVSGAVTIGGTLTVTTIGGDLVIDPASPIASTNESVNLSAGGNLTVNSNITATGAGGAINATATGGDLTINSAALSSSGDITLQTVTSGDILLNNATIVTDPGAPPPNYGNSTVTLISAGLINQAGGSITSNELDGSSAGDAILFGNNIVKKFSFDAGGALGLFSQVGFDIDEPIDAGGGIFLFTPEFINILAGGALDTNGTILLDAGTFIAIADDINSNGNPIELYAGTTITQTAGAITGSTLTGSSGGATILTGADNDIDTLLGFSAGGGFAFTDTDGLTVTGPITGGTGAVALDAGGLLTINGDISGTGASLTGDGVTLAAAATVSGGLGPILVDANGGAADLAGALTTGNSTATAVQIIDASSATLGAITTGVTGTVTLGGAGGDAIDGDVTQTGALVTGTLAGNVGGSATLTNAGNEVAVLGAFTSDGLTLVDAGGLTVAGPVDGGATGIDIETSGAIAVNGALTADNGPIALDATGAGSNIAIGAAVDAGTGTVTLTSGGTISQTAAGIITAGTLTGSSVGSANFLGAVNLVDNIGPFTASGFGLQNGTDLTVAGAIDAGTGAVIIAVTGGSLAIDADLSGALVSLGATGVTQAAGSTVDAGAGTILIDANGGAIDMMGALVTTSTDAAAVTLTDASGAVVGDITTGATGGVVLSAIAGDVTQTADTAIVTGNLTGDATGSVTLLNAGNEIATLGAFTAAGLAVNDSSGGLTLTDSLVIDGDLELNSAGAITQSGGTIVADSLLGSSSGGATFDAAGNEIASLSSFTNTGGGGFTFVTTLGLTVTGDVDAGTGDLAITAPGITFTDQTLTAGGNATLDAGTEALLGGTVDAGGDITGTGSSIDLAGANAGGALNLTAGSGGGVAVVDGSFGTTATLIGGLVEIGSLTGGASVSIEATDLDIGTLSASDEVHILNTGTGATFLGSVSGEGMNLGEDELGGISTANLTIQSADNDIAIGDLAFDAGTGTERINLLTTGMIEITGAVSAESSEVQIGGTDVDTGESAVLHVVATPDSGGRLFMPNSTLHLRASQIAVGQQAMITELEGSTLDGVFDLIADPGSEIYQPTDFYSLSPDNPSSGGAPTLISAASMTVTYANYAIFQNTALPGSIPGGVVIGSAEANGTLTLNSSGSSADNGFSMSGEINGRRGVETAVLGPNFIILNDVNLNNSRLNGCIVGSGANCIINIVTTTFFNFFDESRADVLSAGRDLTLTLDPVVGANNEALFSGISSVDDAPPEECDPDGETPCPQEETQDDPAS